MVVRNRSARLLVPFTWLGLLIVTTCGGDPGVSKAQAYCHDVIQMGCVRAFECVPPADRGATFLTTYGASLERCQAASDQCAQYPAQCPHFDPDAGMVCLSEFTNSTCTQLLFIDDNGDPAIGLPGSCGAAVCPP
jgi:hypothetical protein